MPLSQACNAAALRGVMRAYTRAFTFRRVCVDLDVAPGPERQRVRRALRDFELRGEIIRSNEKYMYANSFRLGERGSPLRRRILKAIYVSDRFIVRDIELLAGLERNYINKVIRRLIAAGYLIRSGKMAGNEWHYRIVSRDRFRLEVM